jgi:sialate O-acetylesterase
MKKFAVTIGLFAAIWGSTAMSQVRLPNLFSDHGVFQRERPIHIWGWSDPRENLTIHFHNQSVETTTANLFNGAGLPASTFGTE